MVKGDLKSMMDVEIITMVGFLSLDMEILFGRGFGGPDKVNLSSRV